jgi:hypothetical protein
MRLSLLLSGELLLSDPRHISEFGILELTPTRSIPPASGLPAARYGDWFPNHGLTGSNPL